MHASDTFLMKSSCGEPKGRGWPIFPETRLPVRPIDFTAYAVHELVPNMTHES